MLEKSNIRHIVDVFFQNPTTEFHIRELSRKCNISAPAVMDAINTLSKHGMVKTYRKANLRIAKASNSVYFIRAKRVANIESVYESGLVDYLIDLYEKPHAIVLFGSFSRGDDIETSDIDIAVITKMHMEQNLSDFEKKLSRKISVHEIDVKKVGPEFYNNMLNGIVMDGAIQ